jgi:hypothetical protein
MSRFPGLVGPSNVTRSVNIDSERTINYVLEAPGAGGPKVQASLYGRPAVTPWLAVASGPHRAAFYQDGRAWVISGIYFAEVFASQTVTIRGIVAADANPATISSNGGADGSGGHQLFVVSGGFGYIFDLVSNAFTTITAAAFPLPCLMGGFLDNYFIALKGQSDQFNLSNLNDGLTWDALDVAEISQWPGNILALIVSHQELWPFSATKVNPWYDSAASFPLQPVPGASIEHGILAPWSLQGLDNTLLWISQTLQGGAVVVRADGYNPKIISPVAVNTALQRIPNVEDTIAWSCQIDGHAFYCLYAAENDTQWVYDLSNDSWSEWGHWNTNTMVYEPFVARTHMFAFGKHLVGDRQSGTLYELSFSAYIDTVRLT